MAKHGADAAPHWLLLIHQIPPKPAYFRAKVGRRLQRAGAVPIKNSVYVLPLQEQTQEDFQWIAREIASEGGDATICRASFVEGISEEQIHRLFHVAREAEYAQIAEEARDAVRGVPSKLGRDDERRGALESDLARLKKRLDEVYAIDFFGAPGREAAVSAVSTLEQRLRTPEAKPAEKTGKPKRADYRGRVWVTRKNVHVDRIASAWLIKRFIDEKASFRFVPGQGYKARPSELTFDMFEATFTHVGDRCTFEVLLDQFDVRDTGLRHIAEIVHDIDVKDGKFARDEAPGFASLIAAIALTRKEDEERIALGSTFLDALLELYRRRRA
jgi:hypothetical protein